MSTFTPFCQLVFFNKNKSEQYVFETKKGFKQILLIEQYVNYLKKVGI